MAFQIMSCHEISAYLSEKKQVESKKISSQTKKKNKSNQKISSQVHCFNILILTENVLLLGDTCIIEGWLDKLETPGEDLDSIFSSCIHFYECENYRTKN
ncbi:CLUMA_CG000286, isoform A [Clunio marinus]|uniref:CLUMA_CG000286, isoform A n=1 Tax=Clunio marinus TaxID=568069 RepID=A0A1J1HEA1_9DIPT|nr:CLUMA_CG000286, isoform A [Clunio marinus]